MGNYNNCLSSDYGQCAGREILGESVIQLRLESINSSSFTFRVGKCSNTFQFGGQAYIKLSSACGTVVGSNSYSPGGTSFVVNVPFSELGTFTSGTLNFVALIHPSNSSSIGYYTRSVAITASTQSCGSLSSGQLGGGSETTSSFVADWSSVSGATSYEINVKRASDANYNNPVYYNTTSLSEITVTGLQSGESYKYQVRARCGSVYGQWSPSSSSTFTTTQSCGSLSSGQLGGGSETTSSFVADWSSVSGATSYEINVKRASDANYNNPVYYNTTSLSEITVTGLQSGESYKYQIRARCGSVYGQWSPSSSSSFMTTGSSGSITLTEPQSGWAYLLKEATGQGYLPIRWSYSGTENINLELLRDNNDFVSTIPSQPNDGDYDWEISTSVNAGDYRILAYPSGTTGNGTHSGIFKLIDRPTLSSPTSNEQITTPPTSITYTWAKQNPSGHGTYEIRLRDVTTGVVLLDYQNVGDNSSYTHNYSYEDGHEYSWVVRIKAGINNRYSESVPRSFTVGTTSNGPITLTEPQSGWAYLLKEGTGQGYLPIRWSYNGTENINLELLRDNNDFVSTIPSQTNDGEYDWEISTSVNAGDYRILVYPSGTTGNGTHSGIFKLIDRPTLSSPTSNQQITTPPTSITYSWAKQNPSGHGTYEIRLRDVTTGVVLLDYQNVGDNSSYTHNYGYEDGHEYSWVVRIKAGINNRYSESVPRRFTVGTTGNGPITLTEPQAGWAYLLKEGTGQGYLPIRWSYQGTEDINFELLRGNNDFIQSIPFQTNTGVYDWEISNTVVAGNYKVLAYPAGTTGNGTHSGVFKLIDRPVLSNPSAGQELTGDNSRVTYTWVRHNPVGLGSYEIRLRDVTTNTVILDYVNVGDVSSYEHVYNYEFGHNYSWVIRIKSGVNNRVLESAPSTFTIASAGNCGYTDFGSNTDGLSEAQCLCSLGYLDDDGTAQPNQHIIREDLAKLVFLAVNQGDGAVVAQYFPTPYEDLDDNSASYHKYAKALLYLEYGDGISPFTRSFTHFRPGAKIERKYALKVVLEAFDIKPDESNGGTIQQVAYGSDAYGYVHKAWDMGLISSTNINSNDFITRRDVFIILSRLLSYGACDCTRGCWDKPTHADYFYPGNLKLNYISRSPGLSEGYMDLYTQTPFNIPSIGFNLNFTFGYNNFWLELPESLQAMQPLGRGWTHNFNAYIVEETSGSVDYLYVVWPSGKIHQYRKSNRVCTTPGVFDIMTIDANGRYQIRKKNQVTYEFAKPAGGDVYYLAGMTDRNNNYINAALTQKNYNGTPRFVTDFARDLPNRRLAFEYDSQHRLTEVIEQTSGRSVRFTYDNYGRLKSYINPKGNTTQFTYGDYDGSERFLVKAIKYPRNNEVEVTYDQNRKLSSLVLPGAASSFRFSHNANYSSSSQRVSVVTEDLANASTTQTTFDDNGHFLQSTTGNTTTAINSRNEEYQPTVITFGDKVSRMTYDNWGNVTKVTSPEGIVNEFTYTILHDIKKVTDGKGYSTVYFYDGNNNLDRIVDNIGYTTDYAVNGRGQVTRITNPEGISTTFAYDNFGNQTQINSPLGISTSMEYDNISRLTKSTNPKGQQTEYEYDLHSMITRIRRISTGGDVTTRYGFDQNDNLTSITNANNGVTSMTYNNRDQIATQTFGDDTHRYTYDNDGKLDRYTKPSNDIRQYNYDNQGRVTYDGYATYSYDRRSNITRVAYNGYTDFFYDSDNRVLRVSDIYGKNVRYTYDDNNNVTRLTYPEGFEVDYEYDRNNRLRTISWSAGGTQSISYTYYKDDRLKQVSYPNGTYTTYDYDAAGRMTGIFNRRSDGSTISTHVFTMDQLGNHLTETNTGPYSGPPPLVAVTHTGRYNAENELTSYAGSDTRWDPDGNLDYIDGESEITFDKKNLLTKYSNHVYRYDGLGLMRQAVRPAQTRRYAWDVRGMGNIITEYNSNGTPLYYYIHGLGLAARIDATDMQDTRYYHYDFRGSTIAMTDMSQTITHSYDYLPYGEIIRSSEEDTNPFTYVGKYGVMHEASGRYYMRARHYDASSGRFISEDPVWHDNLFPYADGNPIINFDRNGRASEDIMCSESNPIYHVPHENEPVSILYDDGITNIKAFTVDCLQSQTYTECNASVLNLEAGGDVTKNWNSELNVRNHTVKGDVGFDADNFSYGAEIGYDYLEAEAEHCLNIGNVDLKVGGGGALGSLKAGGRIGLRTEIELGVLIGGNLFVEFGSNNTLCNNGLHGG